MLDLNTIEDAINDLDLAMIAERTDHNPNMTDSQNMDHWACILFIKPAWVTDEAAYLNDFKSPPARMDLVFSTGSAHKGRKPELAEVLNCIASDAATVADCDSFEQWADDLGYDPDSRSAERTYQAVCDQSQRLLDLIGDANYEALLYETERL